MVTIKRFRILQTSRFLVFKILYQKSREWQKTYPDLQIQYMYVCIKNQLKKGNA